MHSLHATCLLLQTKFDIHFPYNEENMKIELINLKTLCLWVRKVRVDYINQNNAIKWTEECIRCVSNGVYNCIRVYLNLRWCEPSKNLTKFISLTLGDKEEVTTCPTMEYGLSVSDILLHHSIFSEGHNASNRNRSRCPRRQGRNID